MNVYANCGYLTNNNNKEQKNKATMELLPTLKSFHSEASRYTIFEWEFDTEGECLGIIHISQEIH